MAAAPFQGVWVWIWEFANCDGGDYNAIAQRVKNAGVAGVIVKAADGPHWFRQTQAGNPNTVPLSTIVKELQARGLGVGTWNYCYGADVPGEITMALETINIAQPDFHVCDVEGEYEGLPNPAANADAYIAGVRAGMQVACPLAYAPLPAIRFHQALPYYQLTTAGYPMLPQIYWTLLDWTVDKAVGWFYEDVAKYGLGAQPIYPIYMDAIDDGAARPTNGDVQHFLDLVKAQGAQGISVWSYQHLDQSSWARIALAVQAFPAPPSASHPLAPRSPPHTI